MFRQPAVAGSFYYFDPGMLKEQIDGFLREETDKVDALGVMSPHAGYDYSGRVAARVFQRTSPADTYVILGPNHTGMGSPFSIMKEGIWRTPFGDAKVESELGADILRHSRFLEFDFWAHQREHSIEVQLPFIQYFNPEFQFVPITVSHFRGEEFVDVYKDIGEAIASAISARKDRVVVVASTDLTHYESQQTANENDKAAMDAVLALDPEALVSTVASKHISMCGFGPTAAMLYACRKLGASSAELVDYMTSGDATGDYAKVVGYGGILVK